MTKNFLEFSRITQSELPPPPEVGEHGELKQVKLGAQTAEKASAKSYAQLFKVTREAIISDELAEIAVTFFEAGRSVSRGIADSVFAILTGNPTLSDNVELFHADHNNLVSSGSGAPPSVTTLDAINSSMMSQTGPAGSVLNIRPAIVIGTPDMTSTLAILRTAINGADPTGESSGKITTLTDARLGGTGWFALANPRLHSGIEVVTPTRGSALRFERRQTVATDAQHFLIGAD